MSNIAKHWPYKSPMRKSQVEVFDWMETLPKEIKYIIVQSPVGAGKSPVGITFAKYLANGLGNSYVLTPQKILQQQYMDTFDKILVHQVKGKTNYSCNKTGTTCEVGDLLPPKCEVCPYKINLEQSKTAPNVVMNYTIAMLFFSFIKGFYAKRDLIICDEAHTLEHNLTEFSAMTITQHRCKTIRENFQIHVPSSLEEAYLWLNEYYYPELQRKIEAIETDITEIKNNIAIGKAASREDYKKLSSYISFSMEKARLDEFFSEDIDSVVDNYVFVTTDNKSFKIKELFGKRNFKILDSMADRMLFMSATIDKESFCRDLGLPLDKTAFLSIDSEFKKENRQVIYRPVVKMTYGWDSPQNKPLRDSLVKEIISICKSHGKENGIIHTGNFALAKVLINELKNKIPQEIMHHNADMEDTESRDVVIEMFTNCTKPSLLISPSITEGLDLKDDKGRFAIIGKVPYPFLGDAWIKKRMQLSQEWYSRQAVTGIIQGCGRIVRSIDDYGKVYILDSSFEVLYRQMKSKIPQWWKDALIFE